MGYQPEVADDDLTGAILDRAVEVHRELGSDQREKTYREALTFALEEDGFDVESEADMSIPFRDRNLGNARADVVVEQEVVLELKVVNRATEKHFQQLARNVRSFEATRGLLLNFGEATLFSRRYVNGYEPGSD